MRRYDRQRSPYRDRPRSPYSNNRSVSPSRQDGANRSYDRSPGKTLPLNSKGLDAHATKL
jgi:hypothetical protein